MISLLSQSPKWNVIISSNGNDSLDELWMNMQANHRADSDLLLAIWGRDKQQID